MLRITGCLSLFFFIAALNIHSQQENFTLSGYVRDSASGESLIGATVYEPGLKAGTSTNSYGFFSLTLPGNTSPDILVHLVVSFIGYETRTLSIYLHNDTDTLIFLRPSVLEMSEVEISSQRSSGIEKRTQMSDFNVPVAMVQSLPAILGETDLLKIVQLLPGVKSGTEAMSGYYVRGGSADENLILLDDAPVYNASHLFGFLSVFNPDAVKNINMIKGGFPARYGSRLSSVLDISLKDGHMKEFHGSASVGIIGSRLTLEGPLLQDKTSYIISARRTWLDIAARPFMKGEDLASYYFYDFNTKLNHIFSHRDRIYGSFYMGRDVLYVRQKDLNVADMDMSWGNLTSTFRWNHIFSSKLFANLTAIYSSFRFEVKSETDEYSGESFLAKYHSNIEDIGAKLDLDYSPSPLHYIRFGASLLRHTFSPDVVQIKSNLGGHLDTTLAPSPQIKALEYSAYLEDDMELFSALRANIGFHTSGFNVPGKFFQSVQPRLLLRYLLSERLALKASFAMMAQYIHLLSTNTVGLPNDLWVPSTKNIQPERSYQTAAGAAYGINGYEFSVEAYYKKMENIIEYQQGTSFMLRSTSWEENVETGTGRAYGVEILLRKNTGRLTGWLGYTLSRSKRRFDNLNQGREYPARYDRLHDISLAAVYNISPSLDISGNWVFSTGSSITVPAGYFRMKNKSSGSSGGAEYSPLMKLYSERNGYRLESYHRLDLSLRYTAGNNIWTFSLYNAYNRKNPFFMLFEEDMTLRKVKVKKISLFPIIPGISYSYRF